MYQIEETDFGLKIILSDSFYPYDVAELEKSCDSLLTNGSSCFNVLWDMSFLKLISQATEERFSEFYLYLQEKGLNRSMILYKNDLTYLQFKKLALKNKISHIERYVNVDQCINREKLANRWLLAGIDPNKSAIEVVNYI